MPNKSSKEFVECIQLVYEHKGNSLYLGLGMYMDKIETSSSVQIPLSTLNRHGLIAGATGTEKLKPYSY